MKCTMVEVVLVRVGFGPLSGMEGREERYARGCKLGILVLKLTCVKILFKRCVQKKLVNSHARKLCVKN